MNSSDGSGGPNRPEQPPRNRPRLAVDGDAKSPYADRAATVMVEADDDLTPPPGSVRLPAGRPTPPPVANRLSQAMPAIGVLDADEPTPPPGGAFGYQPTPPPTRTGAYGAVTGGHRPVTGAPQGVPGPGHGTGGYQGVQRPQGGGPLTGQFRAPAGPGPNTGSYNAEHITNTGFIPTDSFKAIQAGDKNKPATGLSVGGRSFEVLEEADAMKRAQFAGGGLLAGAFAGVVLGVINAILQGWDVIDGLPQIAALALVLGIFCALVSALKPDRVEELLDQISFFQDS